MKMRLVDNAVCSFCNSENECLDHVYWDCEATQRFWNDFESYITKHIQSFEIHKTVVWFGVVADRQLLNHMIFSAKKYIYTCSLKQYQPKFRNFLHIMKETYLIEKYIAKRNNGSEKFNTKWLPLIPIFDH